VCGWSVALTKDSRFYPHNIQGEPPAYCKGAYQEYKPRLAVCPFCGEREAISVEGQMPKPPLMWTAAAVCQKCLSRGPEIHAAGDIGKEEKMRELAMRAWGTRSQ